MLFAENVFHGLPPQQDVDLSSVVIRPSVDGDGTVRISRECINNAL